MTAQQGTLLCHYHYDPLDRVTNCAPLDQPDIQRFYRKSRLATEMQGQVRHSMLEHEGQPLAQQQRLVGAIESVLLATDLQRSVLHSVSAGQHQQPVYSPYGHRSPEDGLTSLLGFNSERRDPVTGHYLLGNGYRAFNPVLMRFNSPDSLSPFGKGGVNAYVYCLGDPVNLIDPKGEFPMLARGINQLVSSPVAALRQAWKGGVAVKKAVVGSFKKTPGPYSATESAMKGLSRSNPEKHRVIVKESAALVDEAKLYNVGAEYRLARKAAEPPTIARFARSNGFSEQDLFAQDGYRNFPEVQKQYALSQNPQVIERLRQADVNLLVATGDYIKKYPDSKSSTLKLVEYIRSN
ncbi:RHS repeat-associated core domain-containing protein [Pseudomonas jessenii]|uniref:RHS repeat-associated core domain-containing protein n=1 Tax=Pseudomonas jessenii TaxID=77298 RepID=UPI0030C5E210